MSGFFSAIVRPFTSSPSQGAHRDYRGGGGRSPNDYEDDLYSGSSSSEDETSSLLMSDEDYVDEDDEDNNAAAPAVHARVRQRRAVTTEDRSASIVRKRAKPLYSGSEVHRSGATMDRSLAQSIYEADLETLSQLNKFFAEEASHGVDEEGADTEAYREQHRNLLFIKAKDDMTRASNMIEANLKRVYAKRAELEKQIRERKAMLERRPMSGMGRSGKKGVLSDGIMVRMLKQHRACMKQVEKYETFADAIDQQISEFETGNMLRSVVHTQHRAMRSMSTALPDKKELQEATEDLSKLMANVAVSREGILKLMDRGSMPLGENSPSITDEDIYADYMDLFGEGEDEDADPVRHHVEYVVEEEPEQREVEEEDGLSEHDLDMMLLPDAPTGPLAEEEDPGRAPVPLAGE